MDKKVTPTSCKNTYKNPYFTKEESLISVTICSQQDYMEE